MAHRVVIVGGGFGGLLAARNLRDPGIEVELIDRRNFHLFQPLLYQVATGALSPANIAAPLRAILARQKNVHVHLAEVTDFSTANREVIYRGGETTYDTLIVATGATHSYFGRDDWERKAPGLKTLEDATEIRRRFLLAFERAEMEADPARRRALLTFVVVGGGPTGVEMAGAIAEIARHTLRREFRNIDSAAAHVILVEAADRVLGTFVEKLSDAGRRQLERVGVEVRCHAKVIAIDSNCVKIETPNGPETIDAATIVWAAGVKASSLTLKLAEQTGATLDRAGRIAVEPDLTIPGHPNIFAIGDLATFTHQTGKPLPGVAPVAMQQGQYVARLIKTRLANGKLPPPFHYRDKGSMATIGRAAAIADLGWIRFTGFIAWLAWLFIHLILLVQFQNRVLVLIQWAWGYLTWNRSARLITAPPDRNSQFADDRNNANG